MDSEKMAGRFNKLFHDYGPWIMLASVTLVVLVLLAIWRFSTQRMQDDGAQRTVAVVATLP